MATCLTMSALPSAYRRDTANWQAVIFNPLAPNDIYISYRTANLQTLHFKYLFNKYTY